MLPWLTSWEILPGPFLARFVRRHGQRMIMWRIDVLQLVVHVLQGEYLWVGRFSKTAD